MQHDDSRISEAFAHHLRTVRRERGLSIDRLAAIAAVRRAMISQIEHGVTAPTINIVARLARALEIDIADMIGDQGPTVTRASERAAYVSASVVVSSVTPQDRASSPRMFELVLAPHAIVSAIRTAADANLCIVEGRVRVDLDYETQLLERGDAMCFRLDRTRAFANPLNTPATLLLVTATAGCPVEV